MGVRTAEESVLLTRWGAIRLPRRRAGRIYPAVKRVLDVATAILLLLLFAFPMFLAAVLVRSESSGGAIFRQKRVGRDLRPFTVYKFRTMRVSAPHDRPSASLGTEERKRYLTRVGRVLRRSGFDELPQLWNVIRGEMSLVGPRPVIPEERTLHALRAALGATAVRPGIAGLAQAEGRDERCAEEKAYLDAVYARSVSALLDATILLRTVGTVISGAGCN